MKNKKYRPPPAWRLALAQAPARAYFSPVFWGAEHLDANRPALYVGNHTLYSIDAGLMMDYLNRQHGIFLRALGDHFHFQVPLWGDLLTRYGVVPGTPENCHELMQQQQSILVFPGGAREVMRRRSDHDHLVWKQRLGFARMAMQHGYDIVPFASVGPNESWKIVLDADDVKKSRAWSFLSKSQRVRDITRDGDVIAPLVRGISLTPIPKPQRFYFCFGPRISTKLWQDHAEDTDALWQVRGQVESAIETMMGELKRYREHDREVNWSRLRRWLAPLHVN